MAGTTLESCYRRAEDEGGIELPHAKWAYRERLEAGNQERANGIKKTFVILKKSQERPFISLGSPHSSTSAL